MLGLAVSSLTFEGFKESECENLFDRAPAMGYRYVEFNLWYASSLLPEKIMRLKEKCSQSGLQPAALHVSAFGGNTSEELAWNTAHKMRAMEAAVELGCRRVVASVSDKCQSLDSVVKQMELLEAEAEKLGILICLENHCKNPLAVSKDYEYLFERTDTKNIGICLDGGHLEAAGGRIYDFIERWYPKIYHLHLKENMTFGKKTFCRFGLGGTDNRQMVRRMCEKGYSGYMSVELSPEIGESGDFIPFSDEDRKKPIEMFKDLER